MAQNAEKRYNPDIYMQMSNLSCFFHRKNVNSVKYMNGMNIIALKRFALCVLNLSNP